MTDTNIYSLCDKLQDCVSVFENNIALQIKKDAKYVSYTYKEFYCKSITIAHSLMNAGVAKGDRIALVLENRPEWGFIYFGILYAGAIAVPIDPQSHKEEIEYFLQDSKSKIVFTSEISIPLFENNASSSLKKIIVLDKERSSKNITPFADILHEDVLPEKMPAVSFDDIASIVYTSGTTGSPKGVILTHRNLYSNFKSIESLKIISRTDNILSFLPLHHTFPFMVTLIIPLFLGARITYVSSLKSDVLLECMKDTGVTILTGVPQLFYMFYKSIASRMSMMNFYIRIPLSVFINSLYFLRKASGINISRILLGKIHSSFGNKLRFFVSGGAPLDKNVARFLIKIGFTIIEGYGLTETSPVVSLNPIRKQKIGSVGRIIPDVQVRINRPDSRGTGEILIKGPNVMKGYYKKPEETSNVLKENWFHTGDIGYIDNEGYLYITGRLKEIIILSSGKNISPAEVESHYGKSPYIKEICVFGTGERSDENLAAVIVPDLEYYRSINEINIFETIKWQLETLSKQLPYYKRITKFIIIKEDLPKTRLLKIKRFEVKKRYSVMLEGAKTDAHQLEGSPADEDLQLLSSEAGKKILDIIHQEISIERNIRVQDHLELDLGIDSLGRVQLIALIERTFNITIEDSLMAGVHSVAELIIETEKLILSKGMTDTVAARTHIQEELWSEILQRKPPENIIRKIDFSHAWIVRLWTIAVRKSLYVIFKIFFRIKLINTSNLLLEKPFIVCPNHGSFLDGFIIAASLPSWFKNDMYFLGMKAYFEGPLIRRFTKLIRVVPIDPSTNLIEAMQSYAYIISRGRTACVFPEGSRTIDGKVKDFKKGIGILAKELHVPLIPVYISGSYESWPRTKIFPTPHAISVIFGEPSDTEELISKGKQLGAHDDYEAIAAGIREKVLELQERL